MGAMEVKMNTLVVYYTMGGTTKETVDLMKKRAREKEFDIINIQNNKKIDLSTYQRVYIGSGVYGGNMPMEIASFVFDHANELRQKEVTVFMHALGSEDKYQKIAAKVIAPLGNKRIDVFYLGGKADLSKQNFFIRALMKKLAKAKNLNMEYPNNISQSAIESLLETI